MKKIQKLVIDWQLKTFGVNTVHYMGIFNHLKQEVNEVGQELYKSNTSFQKLRMELADCIILLIGLADSFGIDLDIAVREKMGLNKKRKWHKPNKLGIIQHKKDGRGK